MIPRSTLRFLCFFLFMGCVIALWDAHTPRNETMSVTLRQMAPDDDAARELRQAQADQSRLATGIGVILAVGVIWVLHSNRQKRSKEQKPESVKASEAITLKR